MTRRGHNHLVIAGTPEIVANFTKALPPQLKDKLITTLDCHPRNGIYAVVVKALEFFAANEHIESHSHVEELEKAVLTNGLGVTGIKETKLALSEGNADLLIIDHNLNEPVLKEELVRLATRTGVPIETVKDSDALRRLSGVGCLLRFKPQENQAA